MSCRTSGAGSAAPGDAAGSALPLCTGSSLRPLAVGYLRMWPSDLPGHADALTAQLQAFAHKSGLVLTDVYAEQVDVPASREGAAFRALVDALRRPHLNTAIIPTPLHFSRFGGMYRAMCTVIAVETGADVLIVSEHSGGSP